MLRVEVKYSEFTHTHRRHRRDATVELSRVEVLTRCDDDCRRIWTKIWKLNMLRIFPAELSCVGGVYAPVGCRDPVSNSAASGIEVNC